MAMADDDQRWTRVEQLFERALRWPLDQRAARLDAVCEGDAELRNEIDRLLAADAATGGVLDHATAIRARAQLADASLALGQRVGAWQIVGTLGRGGMGIVYRVQRADGLYQQHAALKVIRGGWLTEELVPRFQRERQILAHLQHPGIARLLDAGATPDGLPYLVMELVSGLPITEWATRRSLDTPACIELLLRACEAVEYAHRNFVVHRDLKPGNILVDTDDRIRLLDFGIARWLMEPTAEVPQLTRSGLLPFTPEYAAPEQLRGETITAATDVFSLGVVLHELLTGARPWTDAAPTDDRSTTASPRLPSRRTGLTEERHQALRGDLDAIVLKAIEPDPSARYATVEEFSADLHRYLRHEPVRARSAGTLYRARKFLVRHRWGAAGSAALLVAVVIGMAATAWQARERLAEARKAQAITAFVTSLFEAVDPARARGTEPTARELVDAGAARLSSELQDEPAVRGEIASLLGDLYGRLDDNDRALALLQQAVDLLAGAHGADSVELAHARLLRARAFVARGEDEAALSDLSLARQVLQAAGASVDEAEALDLAAVVEGRRGNLVEAQQMTMAALELRSATLGREHADVAMSYNNLGVLARNRGEYAAARGYHDQALVIRRAALPADHPHIAVSLNNLGALDLAEGEFATAVDRFQEALDIATRVNGPTHQDTIATLNNLGSALLRLGRLDEAAAAWHRVLEYWQATDRPTHPNALATRLNLTTVRRLRGDAHGALDEYGLIAQALATTLGEEHPVFAAVLTQQARCLADLGALAQAAVLTARAIELRDHALGVGHPDTGELVRDLAVLALARGDVPAAQSLLAQAIAIQSAGQPATHPGLLTTEMWLGSALREDGQPAAAAALQAEMLRQLHARLASTHPDFAVLEAEFGRSLLDAGRYAEARQHLQLARDACGTRFGTDAWQCAEIDLLLRGFTRA
jgi:serine/threonine-protein kinase